MFTYEVTNAHSLSCSSFTVNYCLFTHSNVSYRFFREKDNVMLE